jgi:hypothetical protein
VVVDRLTVPVSCQGRRGSAKRIHWRREKGNGGADLILKTRQRKV